MIDKAVSTQTYIPLQQEITKHNRNANSHVLTCSQLIHLLRLIKEMKLNLPAVTQNLTAVTSHLKGTCQSHA